MLRCTRNVPDRFCPLCELFQHVIPGDETRVTGPPILDSMGHVVLARRSTEPEQYAIWPQSVSARI